VVVVVVAVEEAVVALVTAVDVAAVVAVVALVTVVDVVEDVEAAVVVSRPTVVASVTSRARRSLSTKRFLELLITFVWSLNRFSFHVFRLLCCDELMTIKVPDFSLICINSSLYVC
jgi:hypothetical protein